LSVRCVLAIGQSISGAKAPQVNAAVQQAQEPQGPARNNNSSRTSR
jgi:hypothetical protein